MQTIQTCIIGAFLLLGATVEVKAEVSKNVGEPASSAVKSAGSEAYFPKGTEIDDHYYRAALLPSMMHIHRKGEAWQRPVSSSDGLAGDPHVRSGAL
jgi:hypothetical protein